VAGTYRFLVQAFGNAGSEHYERRAELAVAVSAAGEPTGMPDTWEIWHGLEPLRDAAEDADIDDLINLINCQGRPLAGDSDADRLLTATKSTPLHPAAPGGYRWAAPHGDEVGAAAAR
jgi:hypothetical protein